MTDRAKQIARMAEEHAAAWTRGDLETVGDLFADDGSISVNGADPQVGRAAIIQGAAALMETFPGVVVCSVETRSAGTRAVFLWTLEGRHSETGNDVFLPGWHEWQLDANMKVAVCHGFYDAEDMARQVAGTKAAD